MLASAFGNWLYLWGWESHGVGNFADDFLLLIVLQWPVRRATAVVQRRHAEQRAHEAAMRASAQALHDHLGTGHRVAP